MSDKLYRTKDTHYDPFQLKHSMLCNIITQLFIDARIHSYRETVDTQVLSIHNIQCSHQDHKWFYHKYPQQTCLLSLSHIFSEKFAKYTNFEVPTYPKISTIRKKTCFPFFKLSITISFQETAHPLAIV